MNYTVGNTLMTIFVCPSDGQSPQKPSGPLPIVANQSCWQWSGHTNNYFASVGTSSNYPGATDTTGVFTEGGNCYGVQAITDGSSNTIAYGEALIGSFNQGGLKWRDGPVVSTAPSGNPNGLFDVSTNRNSVLTDFQVCQNAFQTTWATNTNNTKGFRWEQDLGGFAIFNTIIPPSSTQYTFGCCRMGASNADCAMALTRAPTATIPAVPTSCSPTAVRGSSSRRSHSRPTGRSGTKGNGEVISSDSY